MAQFPTASCSDLTKSDSILQILNGKRSSRIPVWVMRQAGRYLPEFRESRSKHSFFELVNTPELACNVTLMPIERYKMDAAIIFSDILIVPQILGIDVEMVPSFGPKLSRILKTPNDLVTLKFDNLNMDPIHHLQEAIKVTLNKLNGAVPLIGFAGAPWTLMSYMTDDRTSHQKNVFPQAKKWLYQYPEESQFFLSRLASVVSQVLIAQAKAGAQILMVFESHAELLSHEHSRIFCVPFFKEVERLVRENLVNRVPMIAFPKGNKRVVEELMNSGYDAIALDWTIDPREVTKLNPNKVLMGNMDPSVLYCSRDIIESEVRKMKSRFEGISWIANLGHGIYPDIDPEHLKWFVDAIRS